MCRSVLVRGFCRPRIDQGSGPSSTFYLRYRTSSQWDFFESNLPLLVLCSRNSLSSAEKKTKSGELILIAPLSGQMVFWTGVTLSYFLGVAMSTSSP